MSLHGRIAPASLLLSFLVTGLAACGGGSSGGGGGGGSMFITTCSLGCSNGSAEHQVSCSIGTHSRNGDVSVFFSEPINPATVTPSSFQVIDVQTGQSPVGTRFVDSTDPSGKKMIFRPAVFFDNTGNTVFGLTPGATYRVTIAGEAHGDPGPFIVSTTNALNQSRMQCEFTTTAVIDDLVAGPPRASVLVQRVVPGDPTHGSDFQAADGLNDVWRDSQISFRFNDIMSPATLLNPATHLPTMIKIEVDTDGNPDTAPDRVPLFGRVDLSIDLVKLRTQLQFTPANGMPSGTDPDGQPRWIVVTIPSTVTDLVGNQVANPGEYKFKAEVVLHPESTLPDANGENFTNTANEDRTTSGADWGGGRLTRGVGGGSGRLGALRVPTLQFLKLTTDGTEFRNLSMPDAPSNYTLVRTTGLLDNAHPVTGTPTNPSEYPASPVFWPTIVVTDGIFEFSSLNIDTGGTLRIEGTKYARLFSRGPVNIQGSIDIRGGSPGEHDSFDLQGGTGGAGGPSGGRGGEGGDIYDRTGNGELLGIGARENPNAVIGGSRGQGVGGAGARGAGFGGCACPDPGPVSSCINEPDGNLGGILFSDPGALPGNTEGECTVRQVAAPGGGGAYATSGTAGLPTPPVDAIDPSGSGTVSNGPPCTGNGGNANTVGIEPPDPESGHRVRKLDAQQFLRGGSGGGGGGANLYDTPQGGNFPSSSCYLCDGFFFFAILSEWRDHSGCGGGGGGGALQVCSGSNLVLSGSITAAGGDGGNSKFDTLVIPNVYDGPRHSRGIPGGGGSGGAVHLQALSISIFDRDPNDPHDAARVDVSGGLGGLAFANYLDTTSQIGQGGAGGAGLMRLEDRSGGSNPPATLMTRCSEAPKLAPYDATNDPCGILSLSVGPWDAPAHRPETFSSASSCWMRADGNYFQLTFSADDLTANPPTYGWNMDVVYHDPVSGNDVLTPYRGRDANTPFPSGDFESNLGHDLNYLDAANPPGNTFGTGPFDPARSGGSYMVVRFQGAVADLDTVQNSPCDLVLGGADSQIEPGSLTPWVTHPSELNNFRPRPNIVRFCVVFDSSLSVGSGTINTQINGVTNLKIVALPN